MAGQALDSSLRATLMVVARRAPGDARVQLRVAAFVAGPLGHWCWQRRFLDDPDVARVLAPRSDSRVGVVYVLRALAGAECERKLFADAGVAGDPRLAMVTVYDYDQRRCAYPSYDTIPYHEIKGRWLARQLSMLGNAETHARVLSAMRDDIRVRARVGAGGRGWGVAVASAPGKIGIKSN